MTQRQLPRLRVAMVGGGAIAQAMHLPYIAHLHDRFELAALVEPSISVREALAVRYSIPATYASHVDLLNGADVDAVVIASPNCTHSEVTLAALDAGLHVLVEKPLCITLADADAIVAARDRAGTLVQVGYMNRFDPAFERMLAGLPESPGALRYMSVVVHDPEFGPYLGKGDLVLPVDVPLGHVEAVRAEEARQVEAAVGTGDPAVVRAFSQGFLGSLVHQVNLVHGLLERMGEPLPGEVIDGDWWADGMALTGSVRLANGARWDSAWVQLLQISEYRERIALYFEDSVRSLDFPSPWLKQSPTVYELSTARDGAHTTQTVESYEEAYQRELEAFHRCVATGEPCRTPPEQARLDIEVLTRMFLAAPPGRRRRAQAAAREGRQGGECSVPQGGI
jgi:predicted dehydrogenase